MIGKFQAAMLAAVCLVFGFFGGMIVKGRTASADPAPPPVAASNAPGAYNPDDPALLKQAIAEQRERIEGCVQQIQSLRDDQAKMVTVIYEPTASMSIPVLHGLAAIPIGTNGAAAPKWLVPGKVRPAVVGAHGEAFQYKYLDLTTQKLDGPYIALPAK